MKFPNRLKLLWLGLLTIPSCGSSVPVGAQTSWNITMTSSANSRVVVCTATDLRIKANGTFIKVTSCTPDTLFYQGFQ